MNMIELPSHKKKKADNNQFQLKQIVLVDKILYYHFLNIYEISEIKVNKYY